MRSKNKKKNKKLDRYVALTIIMLLIFGGTISRLSYLQVVKADEYKLKADQKAVTELQEFAPRGEILDKNGIKLASNQQRFLLTFTETEESKLYFYQTMDQVFKTLDDKQETQKDDFELKINPFAFEFRTQDDDVRKQMELRFKKDRGLYDQVKNELYPHKKEKLTEDESKKLDEEVLKITPEATFQYLVTLYDITEKSIFKNDVELYKKDPDTALQLIAKNYQVTNIEEIKTLLENYKSDKKNASSIFSQLIEKCRVSEKELSLQEQRRYMLVKDALKIQSFTAQKPVVIASNLKKETALLFSQELNDLPGIDITIQPIRNYPYAQLGSDFLGYISKINSNQERYEERGYDVNTDYVGVSGIEATYEDVLKGAKGGRIVRLNPQGRILEELGVKESYPGSTVQLTIDSNVQYAAETALDKVMKDLQSKGRQKDVDTSNATRAAAVAVDVNTGAILALVSRPGFDPNDFLNPGGLTTDLYKKYFDPDLEAFGKTKGYDQAKIDKLFPVTSKEKGTRKDQYDIIARPLYNYATFSLTPPGSTFKPITAIAGLESGVITPDTTVVDNGYFDDGHNFKTSFPSDGANGVVNLVSALAKSSNPYFMTVGQKLRDFFGDDKLAEYAWKFGLGVKPGSGVKPSTGIEIPENFGQVFNSQTIKNRFADSYLYITMDALKAGKGFRGNSFTSIELHLTGSESPEVKDARKKIRDQIQDSIKTGNRADDVYKKMLTQLVAIDPIYKGKTFSKDEIANIAYEIEHITVDDGNYQTRIGANIYNASIGQGISTFTPLQLANYVATIVNGGTRYSLHLVDKIIDPNGQVSQEVQPQIIEKTGIKQATIDAVKQGMHAVVGDDGTAAGVFNGFPIDTAGKTGSATYRQDQDELGRTSYGVYLGFAPYEKPQIAVAIVIFDGGHGSFVAPVARAMYEAYFKKELDAVNYVPVNDVTVKPVHDSP